MTDNIIKNKKRGLFTERPKYVPEYVRRGIEPQVYDSARDFVNQPRQTKESALRPPQPPQLLKVAVGTNRNWNSEPEQEPIYDEEIILPDEIQAAIQSNDEKLNSPEPGEFGIFVAGELIFTSDDISAIEAIVENLLLEQNDYQITIEDVIVMKRIKLKIGVLASE